MQPWFFELLGITNSGRSFELGLWLLLAVVGLVLLAREIRSRRNFGEEWLTWIVAIALVGFGALRTFGVLNGTLYLGEKGLMLPSYGVAIATGFGLSIVMSYRDAERSPAAVTGGQMIDLAFWTLVGGLVGARLLYFFTEPSYFIDLCFDPGSVPESGGVRDCLAIVRFWEGGIVFWGGFVGGLGGGALWCRLNHANFLASADIIIPYVPFGHAIGRLGCIAAGCCYGAECESPLGLRYPEGSLAFVDHLEHADLSERAQMLAEGLSHRVHAVQLYEALGELLIFGLIAFVFRTRRRFSGELLLVWMTLYSLLRMSTELFRGDGARGFLIEYPLPAVNRLLGLAETTPTLLSTSQFVSLLVAMAAAALWVVLRRRGANYESA